MKGGIAATLLFQALFAVWLLVRPVSPHVTILGDNIIQVVAGAFGALFCFFPVPSSGQQPLRKSRSKQVAFFCGLSMILGILQGTYWIWFGLLSHPSPIPRVIPDTISLSAFPLLLVGVWRLPRKPLSLSSQVRISLDGLMVMVSAFTFSWYFVLGPTILRSTRSLEHSIVDAAYPFMDVLQIACLLFLGRSSGHLRSVFLLLAIAFTLSVASDSIYVYMALHKEPPQATLLDLGWSFASMLIGVAVLTGRQAMAFTVFDDNPGRLASLWASLMPYALLPLVGVLVLYTEQAGGRAILRHGVFWGAFALVSLILGRQVLALLENRELNGRLEALATTDPLTGLCNHRTFHKLLAEEAAQASRDGQTLAVAMLDVDNFKFFNDAYGHAAGDDVLRQLAAALRQSTLPEDTIGRFGGDEFALLLPLQAAKETRRGQSAEQIQQVLDKALSGLFFQPPGSPSVIPMTISVGVALFPADAGSPLEALELADRRLMHVKTGGGSERPAEELCRELSHSLSGFPMLNALVTAVDNKDRYTRRHSEDVLTYSLHIAEQLGLSPETQRTV